MARKKNRKGFYRMPLQGNFGLGTLADDTIIAGDATKTTLGEDSYAISADITIAIRAHTAGEGPLFVGLTTDDYTVTEIKEALTSTYTPGDLKENEKVRRFVRKIGGFMGLSTEEIMNDGKPIRVKLKHVIGEGANLQVWVWNQHGVALTTGTIVEFFGDLYLRRL